jgi:hypothetical protein
MDWDCIGDRKHIQKCGGLFSGLEANKQFHVSVTTNCDKIAEQLYHSSGHFPKDTKRQKICESILQYYLIWDYEPRVGWHSLPCNLQSPIVREDVIDITLQKRLRLLSVCLTN